MRIVVIETPFVPVPERLDNPFRPLFRRPQPAQQSFGQLEGRQKRLALDLLDTQIHQPVHMLPVPRPRVDRDMREVRAHNLCRADRCFNIVDGQNESARVLNSRSFQYPQPARIAVIYLIAELINDVDLLGINVKSGKWNLGGAQHAGGDLSDAAEAGDDDMAFEAFRQRLRGSERIRPAELDERCHLAGARGDEGRRHDAQADDDQQEMRRRFGQRSDGGGEPDHDERECPRLAEQQAGFERGMRRKSERPHQPVYDGGLEGEERDQGREEPAGMRADEAVVDPHADRHEEQAEKQALERRDVDLDLVPVFRLGEQQAGQEGAELHRRPGGPGDRGGADDGEQGCRHEHLGAAGLADQAQERAHHPSPQDQDSRDRGRGLQYGEQEAGP